MRQFLIDFLKALEAELPPPANCHHAITYAQFGNHEAGWEDRLALQLNVEGVFTCFFLDDKDFNETPEDLAKNVAFASRFSDGDVQHGVGFGQYSEARQA